MSGYLNIKHKINTQRGGSMEASIVVDLPRQPPKGIKLKPRRQASLLISQGQNP